MHFHLSQQLLPLMDSTNIKLEDSSKTKNETQKPEREKEEQNKSAHSIEPDPDNLPQNTTEYEKDEHMAQPSLDDEHKHPIPTAELANINPDMLPDLEKQDNNDREHPNTSTATENVNQDTLPDPERPDNKIDMDEHTRLAADGLLMLQELANLDNPDPLDDDPNSQLMPIGAQLPEDIGIEDDPKVSTTSQSQKDDTSDETIIYDAPDLTNTEDMVTDSLPTPTSSKIISEKDEQEEQPSNKHHDKKTTPTPTSSKILPENDEQEERPSNEHHDKKGMLVIREVGLRKGGTQKDAEDDTPMPTITSSGKVRCDFCRRDFDTLAEQKQHMSRRHPDLLREQQEKRKREKDERIECDQFKQAIETLRQQEREKQKHRKKNTDSDKHKKNPKKKSNQEKREKDEPPRKRPKTSKDSTSNQRRYNCPSDACDESFNTQAELNKHHKNRHPPVICTVCKKAFSTPNTLDRHMYKHRSTLECQYCDEKFTFPSELEMHLIVHEDEPSFFCKSCTRSFMRLGDLREHEESHTSDNHHCTVKGCDFSAPLKRYVRTHIKTTHASKDALPYSCSKCNEKFKFYEQRKRHMTNDHQ